MSNPRSSLDTYRRTGVLTTLFPERAAELVALLEPLLDADIDVAPLVAGADELVRRAFPWVPGVSAIGSTGAADAGDVNATVAATLHTALEPALTQSTGPPEQPHWRLLVHTVLRDDVVHPLFQRLWASADRLTGAPVGSPLWHDLSHNLQATVEYAVLATAVGGIERRDTAALAEQLHGLWLAGNYPRRFAGDRLVLLVAPPA